MLCDRENGKLSDLEWNKTDKFRLRQTAEMGMGNAQQNGNAGGNTQYTQ